MWMISKAGFFSAVEHRDNPELVMIRARAKDDLLNLCQVATQAGIEGLDPSSITTSTESDYRYRIVAPKDSWAKVVSVLAEQIDYDNFKNAIGRDDPHRAGIYSDVWLTLHQIQ